MRPGISVRPLQSITSAFGALIGFAETSRIVSPSTSTETPPSQRVRVRIEQLGVLEEDLCHRKRLPMRSNARCRELRGSCHGGIEHATSAAGPLRGPVGRRRSTERAAGRPGALKAAVQMGVCCRLRSPAGAGPSPRLHRGFPNIDEGPRQSGEPSHRREDYGRRAGISNQKLSQVAVNAHARWRSAGPPDSSRRGTGSGAGRGSDCPTGAGGQDGPQCRDGGDRRGPARSASVGDDAGQGAVQLDVQRPRADEARHDEPRRGPDRRRSRRELEVVPGRQAMDVQPAQGRAVPSRLWRVHRG